jgi:hypothetical protein
VNIFSYGGGVQSTAALVLAAQKRIDYRVFLFANVGEDSEHPATLRYVRDIATPYAAAHGIELTEVVKRTRDGKIQTLYQHATTIEHSIYIPMRFDTGLPGRRKCTTLWKVGPIDAEIKRRLSWHKRDKTNPPVADLAIGISLDEIGRAKIGGDDTRPWLRLVYPLIDLRLDRQDCMNIIRSAGLPVPPKSSCYFCPFKSYADWRRLRDNDPELYDKAIALEAQLSARSARLGRDPLYLTQRGMPLDRAIGNLSQAQMFDDDSGELHHNCAPFACEVSI